MITDWIRGAAWWLAERLGRVDWTQDDVWLREAFDANDRAIEASDVTVTALAAGLNPDPADRALRLLAEVRDDARRGEA